MSRLFSLKIMSHLSFVSCFNMVPSLIFSLWFSLVFFVLLFLIDPESKAVLEKREKKCDYCWVLPLQPMEKWFKAAKHAVELAGEGFSSLWKSPNLMGGKLWNKNPEMLQVKEDPNVTAIYGFLSAVFPFCWFLVCLQVPFEDLLRKTTCVFFLVKQQYFCFRKSALDTNLASVSGWV